MKKVGYIMDTMQQSACLVVNPIMVLNSFAFLFNCTMIGQLGIRLNDGPDVSWCLMLVFGRAHYGST